jgi:hypothetical protein
MLDLDKLFGTKFDVGLLGVGVGLFVGTMSGTFFPATPRTWTLVAGSVGMTGMVGYVVHKQLDPSSRYEAELRERQFQLEGLTLDLEHSTQTLEAASQDFEQLTQSHEDTQAQVTHLQAELRRAHETAANSDEQRQVIIAGLTEHLNAAQTKLAVTETELKGVIQNLEAKLTEFDVSYEKDLDAETTKRIKQVKRDNLTTWFEEFHTGQGNAIEVAERYQQITHTLYQLNVGAKQKLEEIQDYYDETIQQFLSQKQAMMQAHADEIEALNQRIAVLQQQELGRLVEPELIETGYSGIKQAANDLASAIYRMTHKQVVLRVYSVTEKEGEIKVGYGISRGADRVAMAKQIETLTEELKTRVGVHEILDVEPSSTLEGIILRFRLDPAAAFSDDVIYKYMTRASEFGAVLRKHHNSKEGGKPTLRVMTATGGGKTIAVKNLIQSYVTYESGFEIWLSDPQHGSNEDHWDIPKLATDRDSAQRLFKDFVKEFDARSQKESQHPNVPLLGVFDEFDKSHTDTDKDNAKRIWTAIRHQKMRLILMGQSGLVVENGWKWDDMLNCALLFIGDAIKTATGKSNPLSFSRQKLRGLKSDYEAIEAWIAKKNAHLSDPKKYRIALLVNGSYTEFLELPPAITGEIDNGKSRIASRKWERESTAPSTAAEPKPEPIPASPDCPECGAMLTSKNAKTWQCKHANHPEGVQRFFSKSKLQKEMRQK